MGKEILNVRGKICPVPLLLTKRKLEMMHAGEVLEILSDFPQTRDNIQGLVERTGNETLKVEEDEGTFKIVVKKNLPKGKDGVDKADLSCTPPR